ncbi:MAG TPA: hypothetical protein VI916_10450 [Acidimicrobiia bacterium]|nr:hypothetical protein [Acidimicrobiia bacterium]
MTTMLAVEIRRYMARRLTRVLILLALLVSVIVAVSVYAVNDPLIEGQARFLEDGDPRGLTALWPEENADEGILLNSTAFFLLVTGLIAAASMIGAEWKAGTFTHLLTWEPRRPRVAAAKVMAAAILATAIAAGLLLCFSAAFLPTVLAKGTTEGADRSWFMSYLGGVVKISAATGVAAVIGAGIAMIGRNTTAAVGAAFGYFTVAEPMVRGLKPQWQGWLLSENVVAFLTDGIEDPVTLSAGAAGLTIVAYATVIAVAAGALFYRRDIAGAG